LITLVVDQPEVAYGSNTFGLRLTCSKQGRSGRSGAYYITFPIFTIHDRFSSDEAANLSFNRKLCAQRASSGAPLWY
jgi:hypothetical protein